MTQYINLFNPALQKQGDILNLRFVVLLVVASIILIFIMTIVTRERAIKVEKQIKETETHLGEKRVKLVSLAKESTISGNNKITAEIKQVQAVLKSRQHLLSIVESGELGKTNGFSEQLRALARQTVNGLWLTGFRIKSGGGEITIIGNALNAQLLPIYLSHLNSETIFNGTHFATVSINKTEDPPPNVIQNGSTPTALPPHISFQLSSKSPSIGEVVK